MRAGMVGMSGEPGRFAAVGQQVQGRRDMGHNGLRNILAFAALVEAATGVALIIDPAIVIALLLGAGEPGQGITIARFLAIALLGLGLACWPGRRRGTHDSKTFQGMLTYNLLAALLLAYVGAVGHRGVCCFGRALSSMLLWGCFWSGPGTLSDGPSRPTTDPAMGAPTALRTNSLHSPALPC